MAMRQLRYQLERMLFWCVRRFLHLFPASSRQSLGKSFGRIAYRLDGRHRRIAIENWMAAFGTKDSRVAEQSIQSCYEYFGSYLFILLGYFEGDSINSNSFEFSGLEHLDAASKRGNGVLLFGAHYGGWEILALAQAQLGHPMGVVARRLDNPHLERLLRTVRSRTGNFVIDKLEGFRPMLRALRDGKTIAILMDQNVTTQDRIFVDFFGRSASTTPALALLKLKTDAALVPAFAYPLSGNRYRFEYGPEIEVKRSGDRTEDVRRITQACTSVLEEKIRKDPVYWLWMHRRWKTRPATPVDAVPLQGAIAH